MYSLGQYIPGESPVHNRDPRVKIIAVLVLSILIFKTAAGGLVIIAAAALAAAVFMAGIKPVSLFRTLRPVLPLFAILFLLYILFTPGQIQPLFALGPVQISYQGVLLGIIQVGRFILLVLAASLLTMTTSQSQIVIGLERLLHPLKIVGVSSQNVAMMVSLALRFMPLVVGEMESITAAQLARGANFNPRRFSGKIRAITYVAAPLAINVFRRGDQLAEAMEARGYSQGPRTYLYELKMTPADWGLVVIMILLSIAVPGWQ